MTLALASDAPASHSRESPQLFKHKDGPQRPLPKEEENGTREGVEEKDGPSSQEERDRGSVPFWNLRTSSKRVSSARGFAIAVVRGVQGLAPCKGPVRQDAQRAVPCEGLVAAGRDLGLQAGRDRHGASCEGPIEKSE